MLHIWLIVSCCVATWAQNTSVIPIYYLNLDEMTHRKSSMETHLTAHGVKYFKRITSLTPQTCNLLMVESHCNRVGFKDIAIVCSHVNAIYTALNDNSTFAKDSKYFMILEDDVRFTFHIDFDKLISLAPEDFGALQLMMSHKTSIEKYWQAFNRGDVFTPRPRESTIWSAQAIVYNKEVVRRYIDKAVTVDRKGRVGFKLINSFDYKAAAKNPFNSYKPAVASECLFADMFLYSMAHPAYVLNIPTMNSDVSGMNSSLHQAHVAYHVQGFASIEQIQGDIIFGKHPLPPFLFLADKNESSATAESNKATTGTAADAPIPPVSWRAIAGENQVAASHGVPRSFNFKQQPHNEE